MTYDQIKALDAIIQQGSFQAASKVLNRSQPAISAAIKSLEEEFSVQLFSRDQYRANLTQEGKAFHRKAKTALEHMSNLELLGKQLGMGTEPEIRIVVSMLCPLPQLLEVCKALTQKFPLTQINFSVEYLAGINERLHDGEADIAIAPAANLDNSSEYDILPLLSITMVPVASPQFRPLQSGQTLSDLELVNYPQILIRDSSHHSRKLNYGILKDGLHWSVNDHFTKKQIILANLGWGRLPDHLIQEELAKKRLIPLQLESVQTEKFMLHAIRKKGRPVGPVATHLWTDLGQMAHET